MSKEKVDVMVEGGKASAGAAMGPIIIEDNVRILPSTTLSPYFTKLRSGSVVGWNKPNLQTTDSD